MIFERARQMNYIRLSGKGVTKTMKYICCTHLRFLLFRLLLHRRTQPIGTCNVSRRSGWSGLWVVSLAGRLPLSPQSSATATGVSSFSTLSTVVETSAQPVSADVSMAVEAELSAVPCATAATAVTGLNAEKCGNSAAMERIFLQQNAKYSCGRFSGKVIITVSRYLNDFDSAR